MRHGHITDDTRHPRLQVCCQLPHDRNRHVRRADKDIKYSFVSVNKFIDAYKQSPAYQRQQLALSAPPELNSEAPDPLVCSSPPCFTAEYAVGGAAPAIGHEEGSVARGAHQL